MFANGKTESLDEKLDKNLSALFFASKLRQCRIYRAILSRNKESKSDKTKL